MGGDNGATQGADVTSHQNTITDNVVYQGL